MSDLDQEWKPTKIRPQSTMAQAFSSALDSAFSLDSDVNHLSQTVDQKDEKLTQELETRKQQMIIQSRELEALQERIREAEERLKRSTSGATRGGQVQATGKDESS
ncbi:hypothetical protein N7466_008073 [Penicillium verhagenii]|uniref:uncharacterized protein n=1 Tax=Penicillium verhagenii TaxID=1562060 RepID=UPI0025450115|nr:uncharacterized protein N7466_008073 [Penicillium verhagenii]KAJ5923886.1 hypothetical protein N7466_008073 [Penicillium verhagenii]